MLNTFLLFNIFKYTNTKIKFIFLLISKLTQSIFLKFYFVVPYKFYYRVDFKKALLINNILDIKYKKNLTHLSTLYMNNNSLYNIFFTNIIYGRLSDIIYDVIDNLDIILFQLLYTFDALKRKIPTLRFNNLNIYNLGYNKINDINGTYLYEIYNKKYEIPGIGINTIIFNLNNISINGTHNEIYDIRFLIDSLRLFATYSHISLNYKLISFIKLCDKITNKNNTKNIFNDNNIFGKFLL